ncbi:MBG domain-containing protein [Flavobacterium pectinovorum]|uniref:MBG domain-containing protein n=1 Tax=Flavobacterium pectinovorum TaxID=29533 RepID=UPI00265DEEA0|nr:MBG domain-containing protein [Flavobacterium pectinovorum]WKL47487.1 MBG domain-containing protein [Flavobacterium pectinovorum]
MNKNLLIVLAFLLFNIMGYGQKTWTGATSTAWDVDTNWSPAGKPTASDNVIISNAANQPIISAAGASCAILELSNSTPGSVVILTVKSGSFFPASIIMNSTGGDTSDCSLNINAGRVTVTGNVTMNGTALQNDVTFSGEGNLLIGGVMTGGVLNSNAKGTVAYNGTGTRAVGTYTYNNLTISGSGIRTINPSGVIVNGTLAMAGSATASAAPTYGANAALQYNSTSSLTVGPEWISPFFSTGGVEISAPNGLSVVTINNSVEKRFNDGVPLIIDEDASLLISNTDLYLGGDFMNNRGSLNSDGFVYLTGTDNQSIDGFTALRGVSMDKPAGIATFTGNITTGKLLMNGGGTLKLGTGLTHTCTDWQRGIGNMYGGSSLLKISGNVLGTSSSFYAETGTVEFNGGNQSLGAVYIGYNNLVLSGTGIKSFWNIVTVNETLSIATGVVADLRANLVHTAKYIKLGGTPGSGGSWGNSVSNAVNKNDVYFASNNGIVNVGPTIVISTNSLVALTTTYGTPSGSNSFVLSGLAMNEAILVTAPTGFEVSTDGVTFSNTISIGAAGNIASKTLYVRLKGTIDAKDYSGNVVLTSNGTTTVNLPIAVSTVNKAPLTITAVNKDRQYGVANPVLTAIYAGFVNGDAEASLTTLPTIATTAVIGSAVGNYPIIVSGAVSSNYTITYGANAVLAITPAALTITAIDSSKVYGSDNPVLTATYAGFVNGDTQAILTTLPTITTTAVKGSAVGNYPITASGAVSSNYTITYGANASLTITPATLTITANNNSKVYGSDNPVLTATYAGFVNGDTQANLTTVPTIASTAVKGSAVGNYPITASGAVSSNYTITYEANGSLVITPAALTITTNNNNKVYGSDNPVLTATYAGFVNGDTQASLTTLPTITTTAVKGSAVGNYPITASGAVSSNYTITYGANGSLAITPAALTITANNNNKTYGLDNPVLTASYAGFVNGDNEASLTTAPTITTTAVKTSAVGTYPIAASGAVSSNYIISYVPGTLTVTASSNAGLGDLTISEGTLSPAFAEGTKDYTATVPNDIKNITVTPTTADAAATVTVNGKEVPSGTASENIPLEVGKNKITTIITAQDGTINTYTIIVTREPSNDAGLGDLTISEGTLSPAFAEETKDYTAIVPNDIKNITVTPTTADATATVTVNGVEVPSGTASGNIPLEVGENPITTVITAQDGTTQTYTIIVTREASSDAGLTDLVVSEGTLSPTFAEGTKDYTATVPNDVTGITVTPTIADATATVTVNGVEVPSGKASGEIPLQVGENTITTVVTAEDGTTNTYVIVVTREEAASKPSDNAGLSDIVVSEGTLSPEFNTDTKNYTVDVPNETNSIVTTPTPIDPNATVEIIVDGKTVTDNTSPIDLKTGENVVTIVVTAPDGTKETYTVIVNREDAVPVIPSNIITPNGDGKNDVWVVPGLNVYPNNSVKVFDRAARLVYSKNNYNNEWDGTYKGSPLTEDTYYYLIDLGNGSPKLKGFISIIRD